jgi:hypothetical protein
MRLDERLKALEDFNEPGSPATVFLLSMSAGGTGLNLTAATRVFLMDPVSTTTTADPELRARLPLLACTSKFKIICRRKIPTYDTDILKIAIISYRLHKNAYRGTRETPDY